MGAQQTKQIKSLDLNRFQSSLQFISEKETSHFGRVKIYKMLEKPFEYLMKKTYQGFANDSLLDSKYEWYRTLEQNKNSVTIDFITKIESIIIYNKEQGACGNSKQLSLFCKYYFYTLKDIVNRKITRHIYFSEEEIIYIVETLLHLYLQFHRTTNQYLGLFQSQYLFITTQGFLKIYPFILNWAHENNGSESTYLYSHESSSFDETQTTLNVCEKQSKIDEIFLKNKFDDLKDIGLILLEVASLYRSQNFRTENGEIKYDFVRFVLEKSSSQTLKTFKKLIKGIIKENWTVEQIQAQLFVIQEWKDLKKTFSLKLNEDSQKSQFTEQEEFFSEFKKSRLSQLRKSKLTSGKIKPIAVLSKGRQSQLGFSL